MERLSRSKITLDTQTKLITAARHAFATKGYSQTSMDDFTAEVGLTRGALYHHFKSKEGLLLAVIEQIEGEVGQRLQQASDSSPSPWEGFRRRCHTYLELALEPEINRTIL
ncbi:TetR/AcrR family transcriptional regulator [Acinetobacter baumannii]|uniref:TetR/AcrR family transcriptional regulator n=1 Tax=Acinetobacter baumannii TaxID=470 RepID=UPI0029666A71|nr:TetR/AcrR family transcriptional regulator [Acinetobacter baumannii]MDW3027056.1 TetR/AcrR family transcriptional regulator [Acinetobacter baumannii]